MKKLGMRIFACFVVLVMLMSILPTGALAVSDNSKNYGEKTISGSNGNGNIADDDQDDDSSDEEEEDYEDDDTTADKIRDRDRDMLNATGDATRKRSESRNSESDYQTVKTNFANIKSKNPNLDTEEAINSTKDYLIGTIDYMIDLLDEDNEYIDDLEDERDNVEDATTREELADSAKNIKEIWNDARKDRVTASSKAIDNKINAVLKTSENLVVRLENEIATMKENGEDVEDLEEMLDEYKELIDDAKENQEQARNTYMNGNGNNGENIREANRYIVKAGEDIKDANAILRKMLQELKQEREGVVVLTGAGTLNAEGNGTAVISGNVSIEIETDEYAKLVIKDLAGDAVIDTDDADYETSNIDSGNSTDNNRAFVFINLTGEVYIEGSRLTVMVRGTDIELTAEGTGTAVLSGVGDYEIDGEEGEWASRYVDDDDESDEEVDDDTVEAEEEEEEEEEEEDTSDDDDEDSDDDTSDDDEEDDEEDDGNTTEVNDTEV
ncbi:hypothetical protein [Methanolobus profundi]|uniref:Uncharacterized protein n=1 Tax=Methanolobus profundi TaxID=487685 RepID=A0A1I4S195_9EURY|nr:hypothetical protein [Methanolobus profundi]SFM58181.1 hypothetical protein SAMN04488696_1706 [Methanolobus profundi]